MSLVAAVNVMVVTEGGNKLIMTVVTFVMVVVTAVEMVTKVALVLEMVLDVVGGDYGDGGHGDIRSGDGEVRGGHSSGDDGDNVSEPQPFPNPQHSIHTPPGPCQPSALNASTARLIISAPLH